MVRSIVIPLYPHTTDEEIGDLLETLSRVGIEGAQLVHALALEDDSHSVAVRPPAPLDDDGTRVDRPLELLASDVVRSLEQHVHRVRVMLEDAHTFEIRRPERFRDHAEEIGYSRSLELLRLSTEPIAGRIGWRVGADGREWFASEWASA